MVVVVEGGPNPAQPRLGTEARGNTRKTKTGEAPQPCLRGVERTREGGKGRRGTERAGQRTPHNLTDRGRGDGRG